MSVSVTVPATTANLGPGFDCIGAALSLYNRFEFSLLYGSESELASQPAFEIEVRGLDANRVKTDDSNLVYQAFQRCYRQIGQTPPPVQLTIEMEVPLARGLGSSATAIVAGLVGGNTLAGSPLSEAEVMAMAVELEGHPDNVAPALIGGCRLAATNPGAGWTICDVPWNENVVPVVAIPNFELSTAEARRVLPSTYQRQDAIFNAAHLGLLLRALQTGDPDWLRTALQDRIHQPYRQKLIPGYEAVQSAAIAAGAYGMVISGAGPTLLALTDLATAEAIQTAMQKAWEDTGIKSDAHILPLDHQGTVVLA